MLVVSEASTREGAPLRLFRVSVAPLAMPVIWPLANSSSASPPRLAAPVQVAGAAPLVMSSVAWFVVPSDALP